VEGGQAGQDQEENVKKKWTLDDLRYSLKKGEKRTLREVLEKTEKKYT